MKIIYFGSCVSNCNRSVGQTPCDVGTSVICWPSPLFITPRFACNETSDISTKITYYMSYIEIQTLETSTPTMQKYIIRTHHPFYRTANVAVFAPDGTVFADIANAVEGHNMQKLKQIPRLFETYEYSCDGNWLGYTPAESTVLDRQLYLKP